MIKRKVKLGILFTYCLIFIQVLFALSIWFNFLSESVEDRTVMLYQVSYAYVYVSILFLIRQLIRDNVSIVQYFNWIIQLEVLKAVSSLLVSANMIQAKLLVSIFGFLLIILYLLLVVNIHQRKYDDKLAVSGLRPYGIALVFGFIFTLIIWIYAEYPQEFEIYSIVSYLILVIPYGFILRYFNKMKTEVEKMPNEE